MWQRRRQQERVRRRRREQQRVRRRRRERASLAAQTRAEHESCCCRVPARTAAGPEGRHGAPVVRRHRVGWAPNAAEG